VEERRAEAGRQAEDAQRQLAAVSARVEEAAALDVEIRTRVEDLRTEEESLRRSHRPLLPYEPPLRRPRLATQETQLNTKVQQHDAAAVRLYAEESGMEVKRIVTEALRNYLPPEAYEAALATLEETARAEFEIEEAAGIERVTPQGAAAKGGRSA